MWSFSSSVISSSSLLFISSFDIFHCVVAGVCLIGMFLAVFSEDSTPGSQRWSWITTELLPIPLSPSISKDIEHALGGGGGGGGGSSSSRTNGCGRELLSLFPSSIYSCVQMIFSQMFSALCQGELLLLFNAWLWKAVRRIQMMRSIVMLKYCSESKRHFFYLMEKKLLNLPIYRDEGEVTSYLDVKRSLTDAKIWPFMWEIQDVKDTYITVQGRKAYPMSSYSYLDFIREPQVQEAALATARIWATGNHGPRMLGGNATVLRDCERAVARFLNRDDSLLCSAGFLACMSGICGVCKDGDLVVADNRAHASLRAGLKMCGAKILYFKHNDFSHCDKLLVKHRKKYRSCWMVIESVYSMDGDIADLPTAARLCEIHDVKIILDEAHGLGIMGKTGRGLEEHFEMPGAATLIVGTFSKSIGTVGGYIAGSKDMIEFMDFHAPGNVFSAPLPAYCAGAAMKSFQLIDEQSWRIREAQKNGHYLRRILITGLGEWPVDYPNDHKYQIEGQDVSPVIPIVFPDDIDRLMRIASRMLEKGWMVAAVAYPACPLHRPRFRVTATCAYDRKHMDAFVQTLVKVTVDCPPAPMQDLPF